MSKSSKGQSLKQKVIFVTGGAKSGKSSFALGEAAKHEGQKAFIATAEALDEEMVNRIEKHKGQRGDDWDTYEEPIQIAETVARLADRYSVIVLDCLTLWLSNAMHRNADIELEIENFLNILSHYKHDSHIYIVSNEVGTGIVPENKLARQFRDLAGIINQKIAGASDEVFMVVAGIPVKIKG
jgi:adenosylcobinamide kinase/adenosylcobinamide-phosphate guanylyltransferase